MKEETWFDPVKIMVTVVFLLMVGVNALAVLLPLNGVETGAVSDSYPNLFAPAAATFAIWGLIYLWLALYILYQWFEYKGKSAITPIKTKIIGLYFVVSSLANADWIFAWHYNYIGWSVMLMLFILVPLIFINKMLVELELTTLDWVFVRVPFSLYFGWITVATIANITVFLVYKGWTGWGLSEPVWTVVALLLGLLISMAVIFKNRDIAYALVIMWAYTGILSKHISPEGFNGAYPPVIVTAAACLLVILIAIVLVARRIWAGKF